MKKLVTALFTCALLLLGCSNNTPTHEHTFSGQWSYNETQHWRPATCGHDVKGDLANHRFNDWVIDKEATEATDGSKHRNCVVCLYREKEVIPSTGGGTHTHTFSSDWSYDTNCHWHAATCGHDVKSDLASHTLGQWVIDKEATATENGSKHRICSICPYKETASIPATGEEEEEETETESEIDSIQDMNILHAWDWKLNDIRTRLKRIKSAGYGAIQISPMQPHVDGANGAKGDTQNNWWKLYQPLAFKVATGSENILGTKEELTSLCTSANSEGLKVIVDIVSNHLAGTNNNYSSQVYKRYPLHDFGKFNDNSVQAVVQGHIGLPDLDTSNTELQQDVLSMMKEYIDCGVSGFRFDAAKHIETPDDGDYASNYWPFVLNGTIEYALSKGKEKPYYYGEILGTCGKGRSFNAYTKYMSVIDSNNGGDVLGAVIDEDVDDIPSSYSTRQTPDKLVIWAESHDNYANLDENTTRDYDTSLINKAYVIQTSRKDAATLYYARPTDMYVGMCTINDVGGWQYPEVKAINKFHDHYVDKVEKVYTVSDCFVNERGKGSFAGATFVSLKEQNNIEFTVQSLKDGKYIDLVSKNEFSVANSKVTISFTNGVCILIPKDAYTEEEEDPSYISSVVIENAPSDKTYVAWVWGNGSSGSWRLFTKDQGAIGISMNNGESYLIAEFPNNTPSSEFKWENVIRQTENMTYSGNQEIIPFNSLTWKS